MNHTLGYILTFSAGAAISGFVTWRMLKTKYEQIAQNEIDSVKEVFSKKYKDTYDRVKELEKSTKEMAEKDLECISNIKSENEYVPEFEDEGYAPPYIISPEESGIGEYEEKTLTYYADGILTDYYDTIIENVDAVVGRDNLDAFGDYEDDSVFVRNDRYQTDYQILRDIRTYAAASNFNALLAEDE